MVETFEMKKQTTFDVHEAQRSHFELLGLDGEMLKDKIILDVGSGDSGFAASLRGTGQLGTGEIFSLDYSADKYHQHDDNVVAAAAQQMPFGDNFFDIAVSHMAFPEVYYPMLMDDEVLEEMSQTDPYAHEWVETARGGEEKIKDELKKGFVEVVRILKPEGVARLGPRFQTDDPNESLVTRFNSLVLEVIKDVYTNEGGFEFDYELVREGKTQSGYQYQAHVLVIKKNSHVSD